VQYCLAQPLDAFRKQFVGEQRPSRPQFRPLVRRLKPRVWGRVYGSSTLRHKFVIVAVAIAIYLFTPRRTDAASLTLAWDPPSDGITAGYTLLYGTSSGSYPWQINIGMVTSYTVLNLSPGTNYYFVVRAYDAAGAISGPSVEVSATTPSSTASQVTALTLTSNLVSPQLLGTSVGWSSAAAGGVPPYQFQWAVFHSSSWTSWPWSTTSTWTWTPTAAGTDYQVRVAVRSAGNGSATGEMSQSAPFTIAPSVSSVTLTSNLPAPQLAGTSIIWSAVPSGGSSPYQYKWWVYDGKVWTATTTWTTSSTWTWTPATANASYVIRIWVRSAENLTDAAEASASVPYAIKSASRIRTCQGPKCR
jgi:Fibronectin type III domain